MGMAPEHATVRRGAQGPGRVSRPGRGRGAAGGCTSMPAVWIGNEELSRQLLLPRVNQVESCERDDGCRCVHPDQLRLRQLVGIVRAQNDPPCPP